MIYDVPVSQCHEHWTTWTHRLLVVAGNVFRKFYVLDCLAPPVSTYFTFRPAVGPPDLLLHRGENIQTKRSYENQPETRMIRHGLDVGVPAIRGFIRQPLSTSCVGLAQGCNPLASAVFFGAYLCSDQLSCESLLEQLIKLPKRIGTSARYRAVVWTVRMSRSAFNLQRHFKMDRRG